MAARPPWGVCREGGSGPFLAGHVLLPGGGHPGPPAQHAAGGKARDAFGAGLFRLDRHEVATESAQLRPRGEERRRDWTGEPCAGKRRFLGPTDHLFLLHFTPFLSSRLGRHLRPLVGLPLGDPAPRGPGGCARPSGSSSGLHPPLSGPWAMPPVRRACPAEPRLPRPLSAVGTVPAPSVYSRGCSLPFTSALTFSHL